MLGARVNFTFFFFSMSVDRIFSGNFSLKFQVHVLTLNLRLWCIVQFLFVQFLLLDVSWCPALQDCKVYMYSLKYE